VSIAIEKDQLVERCKNGDLSGYKALYGQYVKAMYNTCLRILNNTAEAEDVLQESFTEAFRNIGSFEYRTTFGGWLKQICVNRSINQLKKRKYSVHIDETDVFEKTEENSYDEDETFLKVAAVKKSIMQLPDGYRTVLSLYLLEGYDHEEIAGILQLAESTVRTQYIRAKQKLLHLIQKEYEQAGRIY
jgi:RNA polymerase sigma factor (sigma-70 family)